MGKVIKKSKTETGIDTVLRACLDGFKKLRAAEGDLITLQGITFLFSGNPIIIVSNEELKFFSVNVADCVRKQCMVMFEKYGGDGPEVIPRMLDEKDKTWCQAAHQALLRFNTFLSAALDAERRLAEEEIARRMAPAGIAVGAADAEDQQRARMVELAKLSEERELTPEETAELTVLRSALRDALQQGKTP